MSSRTTVAAATKTIREALDLPTLTPEEATKVWASIREANLQNHGGLLYELFLKCPVMIPVGNYHPLTMLDYLHTSGTGFSDEVIQNFPAELLFRKRDECKIPAEKLRPLILADPKTLLTWVWHQHDLYDESLRDLLLEDVKAKWKIGYPHEIWRLCKGIPAFWESVRDEMLPLFVEKVGSLSNFLEEIGDIIPVDARFKILQNYLEATQKDGERLRKVYDLSLKYLPNDKQKEFYALIEAKVDSLVKAEQEKDPLKSFLLNELSWDEMAFARLDPEGYRKHKAARNGRGREEGYPPWAIHPLFRRSSFD